MPRVTTHVSLPMYDWPEVQGYNDQLWESIGKIFEQAGFATPQHLQRSMDSHELWSGEHCLFSQTCGWPYLQRYCDSVDLVLTPHYAVDGCKGAYNSSRIVCRKKDPRENLMEFRATRLVINAADSQSGFQAMKSALAAAGASAPFFSDCVVSGSHRESIRMVADEKADICAIDPVSWALATRFEPQPVAQLKVIDEGPYTPGLPYVASTALSDQLREINFAQKLGELLSGGLSPVLREQLFICGASTLNESDYHVLQELDQRAVTAGFDRF